MDRNLKASRSRTPAVVAALLIAVVFAAVAWLVMRPLTGMDVTMIAFGAALVALLGAGRAVRSGRPRR
jgi:uncharacterized membrane protein